MQLSFDIDGLPPEAGARGGWRGPAKTKIWLPEQETHKRLKCPLQLIIFTKCEYNTN
jgi:hypothetical protein